MLAREETTPLPWEVIDTVRETGHVKIGGKGFSGLIATIGNGETAPGRFAADAALIVRAVTNHEALVKTLSEIEALSDNCVNAERYGAEEALEDLQAIRAALSRARAASQMKG